MKLKFLTIFVILTLFSCGADKPPKGILSKEKMVPIVLDQHFIEPIFNQRFAIGIPDTNAIEDLYLSVLKKHKVDRKTFEKSVYYYGKHPEQYKEIYDEVLDRLNEMDVKVQQENPAIKR